MLRRAHARSPGLACLPGGREPAADPVPGPFDLRLLRPVTLSITQTGTQTNNATGANYPDLAGDWSVSNPSRSQWFNASAFKAQPNYTWGSAPPNFLRGPHTWNMDAAVARDFRVTERFTAQFRVESFDATNSVMFTTGTTQLGAPGFGSVLSVTGNRQSQVALKVLY